MIRGRQGPGRKMFNPADSNANKDQKDFLLGRSRHIYPGGRVLASTMSSASFSSSSFGAVIGVRGSAVSPVLDDSRMPNGAINDMKESIRAGLADLESVSESETTM